MGNGDYFLSNFSKFLKDEVKLDIDEINEYCEILKSNQRDIDSVINSYIINPNMEYTPTEKNEWGTYGDISIGNYVIELCCYGTPAINIYEKKENLIKMLTKEDEIDYYKGHKGALRFIRDIAIDYDGFDTPDKLKNLIDEMKNIAVEALKLDDDYDALK